MRPSCLYLLGPVVLAAPFVLTACDREASEDAAGTSTAEAMAGNNELASADEPVGNETSENVREDVVAPDIARAAEVGSPMEDRVATLGLLNKRNNVSQDLELKPGESRRVGDVIVRLSACERTAPWELPDETGAFVQVLVQSRTDEDRWGKVFSGWLFKGSPGLNVVEHPVYDVWVKDCTMSFPGEEEGSSAASSDSEA